jgi:hypothetical protein
MGIIPKSSDAKEAVGIIPLLILHYVIGIGIAFIGQKTKNVAEFWAGIIVFLVTMCFLALYISAPDAAAFETSPAGALYVFFSLVTWAYILGRVIWIYMKKETKLAFI